MAATLEEWQNFSFASAGFSGEGTFAWKDKSIPTAYETEKTVIFIPNDAEKYDYTQVSGWDKTAKQVVRREAGGNSDDSPTGNAAEER